MIVYENLQEDMGVRPTQLTTKQPACQKLSLIMICSKIYKIYMNVKRCEMCRPDTHALTSYEKDCYLNQASLEKGAIKD